MPKHPKLLRCEIFSCTIFYVHEYDKRTICLYNDVITITVCNKLFGRYRRFLSTFYFYKIAFRWLLYLNEALSKFVKFLFHANYLQLSISFLGVIKDHGAVIGTRTCFYFRRCSKTVHKYSCLYVYHCFQRVKITIFPREPFSGKYKHPCPL